MTTHTDDSLLRRFFGVTTDPQTYRNLLYLALTFPLGVLYFTAIWSGVSIGFGTLPILVGVPILASVVVFAVVLGDLESRLAGGLLDVDVSRAGVPRPDSEPLFTYLKALVLDPRSYLAVVYLISKFFLGVAAFTLLVTMATLSATFAAAPFLYDLANVRYQVWPNVVVDTLPEALALSIVGILLALVSLHVFNFAARALGLYTELLLDASED